MNIIVIDKDLDSRNIIAQFLARIGQGFMRTTIHRASEK